MILVGGNHSWDCYCRECVTGERAYDENSIIRLGATYMPLRRKGKRRALRGRMKRRMGRGAMGAGGPMPPMPGAGAVGGY
jgi:hypothetical protein